MNDLTKIEISSENLLHNLASIKKYIADLLTQSGGGVNTETGGGDQGSPKIAAVVKANAYGHGVREVVSVVENEVDYFQVDDLMELKEVRQYTDKPVLVFGFVAENQLEELVQNDGILGVYDLDTVRSLDAASAKAGKSTSIHLKVDSLLGRQGILIEEVADFVGDIKDLKNIKLEAIYSHFSNIEDVDHLEHAQKQFEGLMEARGVVEQAGFKDLPYHISATSGILSSTEVNWGGSIVRLGIGLYGMWPSKDLKKKYAEKISLRPVMRWVTKVAQVKDLPADYPIGYGRTVITDAPTKIAVIPQGYSDGYDRRFSNNSEVLIGGRRCPVLGRIAMNMFVVDVTALGAAGEVVEKEDEVVLLGKQGDEEITAQELAEKYETINYEITTKVWPKLKRVLA
jgi:alanine racemase